MRLYWLPERIDWNAALSEARKLSAPEAAQRFLKLANSRIDLLQTTKLDRAAMQLSDSIRPYFARTKPIRLALLGSSTLKHLVPAIRVAALRRGFWVDVFEGQYGMYHQELADPSSELYSFKPDVVLLALDAHHVASSPASRVLDTVASCWELVRHRLGASIIQQTVLPIFPSLLGNNEQNITASPATIIDDVNHGMRELARKQQVYLLSVQALAQKLGTNSLYSAALWFRSKEEIHPAASPLWGDQVGRLLAAIRGLSLKCLVLDLDNTLWGGVIGDDGVDGIVLGQGHASGEAFVAFQKYVAKLAERGVILAVCSKNDDANARAAFEEHPEMVLRMKDIACFNANWMDKATNLRNIAKALNIGLDSLVFADDNPFERNLVRHELPEVSVIELPIDPALYADAIADAGYFEGLTLTREDEERTSQYQANADREKLRESITDLPGYLRGLDMQLTWSPLDSIGMSRTAQLINKSNQFNLTTRRYTQDELLSIANDRDFLSFQFRLVDRFGDNGMISVILGRVDHSANTLNIDTWLMSCRVLGRQVEEAALNLVVDQARERGFHSISGSYIPTSKNSMVKDHYQRLGFRRTSEAMDGTTLWTLALTSHQPKQTFIRIKEGKLERPTGV